MVILHITFLSSGQIGAVTAVESLPFGLTQKAIDAAKRITFEPRRIDGVGQSVTRLMEYSFSIY
jgi:hypothetical protein